MMRILPGLSVILAPVLLLLSSCACKDCPPGWQPSAFAPVFYGFKDYSPGMVVSPIDGPISSKKNSIGLLPGKCRIYYPSTDGSPQNASPLEGCCKFPLIILVHGQCQGVNGPDHYKKWFLLPAQLARSGYVVLIPQLFPDAPEVNHPLVPVLESYRNWILNGWEHSDIVHTNTGVIGHSYGGPAGSSFSLNNNHVKAFASLSGQYDAVHNYVNLDIPKLFLRGDEDADFGESSTGLTNWNSIPSPKHKGQFAGGFHWDYILEDPVNCTNSFGHGVCTKTPQLTAELVTMFFTRYLRRSNTLDSRVPLSLIPPDITLTTDQQFYAGGAYLKAFDNLGDDCQVNMTWVTPDGSGSSTEP